MNTDELKRELLNLQTRAREITEEIAATERKYYDVAEVEEWLLSHKFKPNKKKDRWIRGNLRIYDYGDVVNVESHAELSSFGVEEEWVSDPKDKLQALKKTMGRLLMKEKEKMRELKKSVNLMEKILGMGK